MGDSQLGPMLSLGHEAPVSIWGVAAEVIASSIAQFLVWVIRRHAGGWAVPDLAFRGSVKK